MIYYVYNKCIIYFFLKNILEFPIKACVNFNILSLFW